MNSPVDNTLYSRQTMLHLFIPEHVTIVGCGGVGAWVAVYLALSGVPVLHLCDPDRLELSNLNRLPFTPSDVGKLKTLVLREFLEARRPDLHLFEYGLATPEVLELTEGTVLDCTDRHGTQLFIEKWARDHDRPYIRAGYDGAHITVTNLIPEWTNGLDDTGYEIVPSWVVPASIVAALAVARLMFAPRLTVSASIDEIYQREEKG